MNRQRGRDTQRRLLWGMFLIGLAFAVFFGLGHYFLTLLFLGLACFSLLGMMSTGKPRKIYDGLEEFVWFLGLAILFLPQIAFWPWGVGGFLIICGVSAILGALAKPSIAGIKGMGAISLANQQPHPTKQQPYQAYEQGYPPLEQAPEAYQEGGEVSSQLPQPSPYKQAQTPYPPQSMLRQAGTEPLPPPTAEGPVEPTPLPRSSAEETSDVLQNAAWFKLVQECITLFDKLERTSASMDPQRQELAGYVCSQLEEILERSGVRIISGDVSFNEHFHLPEPARERVAPGTAIAETLSSGFAVGPRVLRRAHVRLKEQASDGKRALESREHIEKEQHS